MLTNYPEEAYAQELQETAGCSTVSNFWPYSPSWWHVQLSFLSELHECRHCKRLPSAGQCIDSHAESRVSFNESRSFCVNYISRSCKRSLANPPQVAAHAESVSLASICQTTCICPGAAKDGWLLHSTDCLCRHHVTIYRCTI